MIKKIITTTTLLAASAALANAANFVTPDISWDDFSGVTPTAQTTVNNSASTSSIYFAGETYLPTKSGNDLVFDGTDDVIYVKGANGASLGYSVSVGTFSFTTSSITLPTSDHSVLATVVLNVDNAQLGIGVDSSGYLVGVYQSSGDIYSSYKSSKTITASDTNTFTFVLDSSTGLRAYVNGEEFLSGNSGLKYTSSAQTAKQLVIGGTSTPNKTTALTLENIYIHSTSLSKEDVAATFTKGGLIPEPSAFGLIAGIGAIALTVSRRRRKQ